MNVHEYQAKQLFRDFGIPVPNGKMCTREDSVREAAQELGGDTWVVKAQVHAGGRGKGGGVKSRPLGGGGGEGRGRYPQHETGHQADGCRGP